VPCAVAGPASLEQPVLELGATTGPVLRLTVLRCGGVTERLSPSTAPGFCILCNLDSEQVRSSCAHIDCGTEMDWAGRGGGAPRPSVKLVGFCSRPIVAGPPLANPERQQGHQTNGPNGGEEPRESEPTDEISDAGAQELHRRACRLEVARLRVHDAAAHRSTSGGYERWHDGSQSRRTRVSISGQTLAAPGSRAIPGNYDGLAEREIAAVAKRPRFRLLEAQELVA
jgi:hypothetical protein